MRRELLQPLLVIVALNPVLSAFQQAKPADTDGVHDAIPPARAASPRVEPTTERGVFFDLYSNTQECAGASFYGPIGPVVSAFAASRTDRNHQPIVPQGSIQGGGVSTGGNLDRIVFRYGSGAPGPFSMVTFSLWTGSSLGAVNASGYRVLRFSIPGALGDETPSDGLADLINVTVDLGIGLATMLNTNTGTQSNAPLIFDPGSEPFDGRFWLSRGAFGASLTSPLETTDFGPVLAQGGTGTVDALRLLDRFDRVLLPDARYFYGGVLCPTRPFAGMFLQLQSASPTPNIVLNDGFDNGVVASNYAPIGPALLSESGGRMNVSTPGGTPAGFAFRYSTPITGNACNVFAGAQLIAANAGDDITFESIVTTTGGGQQTDVTARIIQKGQMGNAADPCRLNIVLTDKNGKKTMYTIEGKKIADIDSSWFDKIGSERQFEIRFKDGTRWDSPKIDPPGDLAGYNVTTTGTSMSFDAHMSEDQHATRLDLVEAFTTLASLSFDPDPDEIGFSINIGSKDFNVRDLIPESVFAYGFSPGGQFVGGAPLAAPGNSFLVADDVLNMVFANAPMRSGASVPATIFITGTTTHGQKLYCGRASVVDPDPLADLIFYDVHHATPVNLTMNATGPHQATGLDPSTVTIHATNRDTGLPQDGLALHVHVDGACGDGSPPLVIVPLGGGNYRAQFSSTIAGSIGVSAEAPGHGGFASTSVRFLAGPPVRLDVELVSLSLVSATPAIVLRSGQPTEFYVTAHDALDNPVYLDPNSASVQVLSSPPGVTISPVGGEPFLMRAQATTSAATGSLVLRHVPSGLTTSIPVVRPVIVGLEPDDNPTYHESTSPMTIRIPFELTLNNGWNATVLNTNLLADTGMTKIAQSIRVVDADATDGFNVFGGMVSPAPCTEVTIPVLIQATAPPVGTRVARFEALIETRDAAAAPEGIVRGVLLPTSLSSNATHPQFGSSVVPLNDATCWIPAIVCDIKKWWLGCIIYVRGATGGKAQVTEAQLCDVNDHINEVWAQACISFSKQFCDVVISGKVNGKDISEAIPTNDDHYKKVNQAARDAVDACGINPGAKCLIYFHVQAQQAGLAGTTRATGIGGRNVTVNKGTRNTRTSPHEVGHCLGCTHESGGGDEHNLMTQTRDAAADDNENINMDQKMTAQGSPYLNSFIIPLYFCITFPLSDSSPSPGDVNGDGAVTLTDLATLLANFGTLSGATRAQGDMDFDHDVDLTDLARLLAVYGSTCL